MKKFRLLLVALLWVCGALSFAAEGAQSDPPASVTPMRNRDVLLMVQNRVDAETIVRVIQASPCNFDTFPPVMQDLQRRGVPNSVLQAMISAPYGPPTNSRGDDSSEDQPIYHFTEYLKQFNLQTGASSRRSRSNQSRNNRARASRPRRQSL